MMARSGRATGLSSSFDLALSATASNNSGPNVVRAIRQTLLYQRISQIFVVTIGLRCP